ncbi:probable WRKY transcription factor 24 [Rhodamnia argentea]|uniref:Probable WRKY transcription factor 24 n=1 Tax=Rhodamnia argentea TaxID=178133 RepID=A0A8B8QLC1_9MYRT|nr:probable WRKY transcription factor 24 [Rhodamnia argentea]
MDSADGPPPPPPELLPPPNSPYLFAPPPSLLSSPLLHPLIDTSASAQALALPSSSSSSDIDWVSLLSGQLGGLRENKPMMMSMENAPMTTMLPENGGVEDRSEGDLKKKVTCRTRRPTQPRIAFQTRSADDILDDGYRWRKYGQKAVKNSVHPRSYYRCTHHTCNVKKQVQRLAKDTSIVVTTYEGIHNHPCEKLMETLTPLLKQMQFLSRF